MTTTPKHLTRTKTDPGPWLDDNPPPYGDRDVPALTPEEEDELRAAWWHEQMMAEELGEVMEEMA